MPIQARILSSLLALTSLLALVVVFPACSTRDEALLDAIEFDDIAEVESLLEGGSDPNGTDWDGDPVLIFALYDEDPEAVRLLLEHGADPHVLFDGRSTLALAAGRNEEMFAVLQKYGVTLQPGEEPDALVEAASMGFVQTIRRLIALGADPRPVGDDAWSPLLAAANAAQLDAYRVLVEAGAEAPAGELVAAALDSGDRAFIDEILTLHSGVPLPDGWFSLVINFGDDAQVAPWLRGLVERHGTPGAEDLARGLFYTTSEQRLESMKLALSLGADPRAYPVLASIAQSTRDGAHDGPTSDDAETHDARTARAVEMLVAAGADVDAPDHDGDRPLAIAVRRGDDHLVGLLLRKGADPNGTSGRDARTPLMMTVATRWDLIALSSPGEEDSDPKALAARAVATAERLVGAGADIARQDTLGRTALHLAAREGKPELTRALLALGSDAEVVDAEGMTPADLARDRRPNDPDEADAPARLFLKVTGVGSIVETMRGRYDEVLQALEPEEGSTPLVQR